MGRTILLLPLACVAGGCSQEPYRAGVWTGSTGAQVAQMVGSQINFSGGAGGRRFETRVVSQRAVVMGELTAENLRASLDSMANDPSVLAVITRMSDAATEQATRSFEQAGLPYLITTPVRRDYAQSHPHAFMLVPSVEEQAEFLAAQALKEPPPRRIALLHVREQAADTLALHIRRALERQGVDSVFAVSFAQSADELNLLAKTEEVVAQKPTILYWIGRTPSLMVVHPTLRHRLPDIRVLSNDLVESFHLYLNPKGIYTGVRFLRYMDPNAADSAVAALRERMIMWIGRNELNNEAALTYDALHGVVQAIRAGATTREKMRQYLRNRPSFTGLTGTVALGEGQRVKRGMELVEIRQNGAVVVR